MKILVTGSKGLIGTALYTRLKQLKIEVIHFDKDFSLDHPHYGNILQIDQLKSAIANCNGIIHLAAVSRVIWGEQNPELCWITNYQASCSIIEQALAAPQKPWILYASSREVYGNPDLIPTTEKTPYQAINIYGESKVAAEQAMLATREKGLNTAIVRYSNVYGSVNDHADRVIPEFCKAAAWGGTIKVEGSFNTFDFTYIDDVIDGTIQIVNLLYENHTELPPFHLTTGQETSLKQAALLANKIGGTHCKIIEAPSRSYDVSNFCGDATMTRKSLNWHPKVMLEEGMQQLIAAYKQQKQEVQTAG